MKSHILTSQLYILFSQFTRRIEKLLFLQVFFLGIIHVAMLFFFLPKNTLFQFCSISFYHETTGKKLTFRSGFYLVLFCSVPSILLISGLVQSNHM